MDGQLYDKLKKKHRLKELSQCHTGKDLLHRLLHEMEITVGADFFTKTEDELITISFNNNLYEDYR